MQFSQASLPLLVCALSFGCASTDIEVSASEAPAEPAPPAPAVLGDPQLGNFSVSLSVADLATSRAFYEKLGFRAPEGPAMSDRGYVILQNGTATIGLFQGFFEGNILTFNPGWNQAAQSVDPFVDVRELQRMFDERGLELTGRADPDSTGPAFLTLTDPDGNAILIDQHR